MIALQLVLLVAGTFVSEDLTCIAAGELVRRAEMHWLIGVGGCTMGIFLGDLGLWLLGRTLGSRAMNLRSIKAKLNTRRVDELGRWIDRNAFGAVIAARFLPGTRVPLYVTAGIVKSNSRRFVLAAMIAALLWTPLLVLLAAALGESFTRPFRQFIGTGWRALLAVLVVTYLVLRLCRLLATEIGRAKLIARVSLLWRWEFWPMIVFYPPVALWVAWLSLRHRGFTTITAANPGIPHGGFVGESKFQILSNLRHAMVSPTVLIETPGELDNTPFEYPIILKPDVGQRGAGVRLIRSRDEAEAHLQATSGTVIAQPFHPGPYEAGIFYYRIPGQSRGKIFSITDKVFSRIVGDGNSTIEQLIWRHPRYRMQAGTFLKRHAEDLNRVLKQDEVFALAVAGNHCQGTMFRDGSYLITPALEAAVDRIAQSFDGFHFGRFDVRYSDVEAFKRGDDLTVIELNGITSESTNIYDPSRTLIWAYRRLFAQWRILFKIGAANRTIGHRVSGLGELLREVVRHYTSPWADALSS